MAEITLKVDVPAPTAEAILAALTEEDKRAIAYKVFQEYFVKQMERDPPKDSWGYRHNNLTPLEKFYGELVSLLKEHLTGQIEADPVYKAKINVIVDNAVQNSDKYLLGAFNQMLLRMVGRALTAHNDTAVQVVNQDQLLRQLVSATGNDDLLPH